MGGVVPVSANSPTRKNVCDDDMRLVREAKQVPGLVQQLKENGDGYRALIAGTGVMALFRRLYGDDPLSVDPVTTEPHPSRISNPTKPTKIIHSAGMQSNKVAVRPSRRR